MARTRLRMKGRRDFPPFSMLIHAYFQSPEYAELSKRAVGLLIDLYCQYRGKNNGDLCAAWSLMSKVGWKSKDQLNKAIQELLDRGWIIVTRQGGRHCPTLYAVTFRGINECGGKLEVQANPVPLNLWKSVNRGTEIAFPKSRRRVKEKSLPRDTGHIAPPHGAIQLLGFANYPATRVSHGGFGRFGAPPHGTLLRLYQGGHGFERAARRGLTDFR